MRVISVSLAGLSLLVAPVAFPQVECTLRGGRDDFLAREGQARRRILDDIARMKFPSLRAAAPPVLKAGEISRQNLIDDAIFGRLERLNVPTARLTTDEEFVRRIHFDLTGHPPTVSETREFIGSTDPNKRSVLIDKLLYSERFSDKWTMWWGDLLKNVAFPAQFDRWYPGRDAFYRWILRNVREQKSIKQMVWECVTGAGNNYDVQAAASNWASNGIVAMGPIQDRYDNMLVQNATTFLGLAHMDCLLCHNGRGHLEQVSVWGAKGTRIEAQRMAAFFARMNWARPTRPTTDFYYRSLEITDRATGNYDLNTNYGNRPDRVPVGSQRFLAPEYRDGRTPQDANWRQAFAYFMVDDPLFSVNFANRLWTEIFRLPLADPVDSLDPDRLDPANLPQAPLALQATHPELLLQLAAELKTRNYDLREFLRLLVESNAYQLSSRYDAEWKVDYLPLHARHYPRRLEGEEIHDAIVKATGIEVPYKVESLDPSPWAIQMPDPTEPRVNGSAVNFMRYFYRGNRDAFFREQHGSILQQLALMNDTFLVSKLRTGISQRLLQISQMNENRAVVEELFMLFLVRIPDDREMQLALNYLSSAGGTRAQRVEDLTWVLVNKVDFLFNY